MLLKLTYNALAVVILFTVSNLVQIKARSNRNEPITLDEESWTQLLKDEWMVDFHAPWCPACKKLEPEWKKFAEWADDLDINVASADVTSNPGISGRFMISGLPTIYHVKDGVFRQYNGPRDHKALIDFIEGQRWLKIEPISKWRAPDTLQMSFVAYSFRISLALRDVHNHLVEEVGLPYYISYLIFALCTVTLGTVLGLLIVFVIDQFCAPRQTSSSVKIDAKSSTAGKKKKTDRNDQEDDDDNVVSKETKAENLRRRGTQQ